MHLFFIYSSVINIQLLPCLGYCEQNCNEYWRVCIVMDRFSSDICPRDCWIIQQFYFQFYKNLPYSSPQLLYCTNLHLSSPTFIICRLFGYGHFDWCEVILHSSFEFHFSKNLIFISLIIYAITPGPKLILLLMVLMKPVPYT